MLRVLFLYVVPVAIVIFAFIDCLLTNGDQVRGLPKPVWAILIVVIPLLGALAWLTIGRIPQKRALNESASGASSSHPRGPDDDPDFIGRL
jgi:Phospholipase_D-nuclease N-terminal